MSGDATPWLASEAGADGARRHAPATLRNRDAIANVLRSALPASGRALEIASGSGEHIVHFAGLFPALDWQPSDPDADARASIAAWTGESGLANIAPPLDLDGMRPDWPELSADAMLCINMIHISPWAATTGLLAHAASILPTGGLLYLYGPFWQAEVPPAPSNIAFDESLRARNAQWGIRAVEDVTAAAEKAGFTLERLVPMPANNLSLFLRKA